MAELASRAVTLAAVRSRLSRPVAQGAGLRRSARRAAPVVAGVLTAGVLAALGVRAAGSSPEGLALAFLAAVTPPLVAADLTHHRLPNALTGPGWVVALASVALTWAGSGAPPVAALATTLVVLAAFGILRAVGGLGMGDVKLAGLLALVLAALSPLAVVGALVAAFVLGGVVALGPLLAGDRSRRLAFGPCLLAGAWLAVAAS